VIGAIKIKEKLGAGGVVVTILPDSNKKYLSTDLVKEEPVREGYYTPQVCFTGYNSISRLATESL
jgi:cysteine synthase A